MARSNMSATRVKPAATLVTLHVVRRERISESFARITLGGGEIDRFVPMGFDQWFRLFLPVAEGSLARLPQKLDTLSYIRYLRIAKTERPVLRNYTVAAYRPDGPDGPELDVDFVLHGSAQDGSSGPAATWATSCEPGDAVALLDEGIAFAPSGRVERRVRLVGDETALPAIGGILASLSRECTGVAVIEVPHASDKRDLDAPDGVRIDWEVRGTGDLAPGHAALHRAIALDSDSDSDGGSGGRGGDEPFYGWVAGEQGLAAGMRRHWVRNGVDKGDISFCGYWRDHGHR